MLESTAIISLLGLALGSFMNSCVYRLPRKISLVWVNSFCPNCGESVSWLGLIPLVSFLLQKGRCTTCKEKIPIRYPLTEALFAGLAIGLFSVFGLSLDFITALVFAFLMILVALIDAKHFIIPNELIIVGLPTGILISGLNSTVALVDALIAGFGSFTLMLAVRAAGNFFFKKESLGLGDVKLAGVIGLFIGITPFLIAVWVASVAGMLFGFVKKGIANTNLHDSSGIGDPQSLPTQPLRQTGAIGIIPFGAFLSLSSLLVFIFKTEIMGYLESWLTLSL